MPPYAALGMAAAELSAITAGSKLFVAPAALCTGSLLAGPLQQCGLATDAAPTMQQGAKTTPAPDQPDAEPQQQQPAKATAPQQPEAQGSSSSQSIYQEVLGRLQLNQGLEHQDDQAMSIWEKLHSRQEWQFRLLLAKHRQAQQQALRTREPGVSLSQLIGAKNS